MTALAGEDKKAGIRVADAQRKRKLQASLKDVKIRDPDEVRWVFTSPDGRELRTHAAHELNRRRILKLNVTYRWPSRRQPR